jgi:NADH:ubiquinone oxidoreductase subunit E
VVIDDEIYGRVSPAELDALITEVKVSEVKA